jgi:hypothetical protein
MSNRFCTQFSIEILQIYKKIMIQHDTTMHYKDNIIIIYMILIVYHTAHCDQANVEGREEHTLRSL